MERTIQSSIKRHKVSDGDQNMPSIDRLSSLPDGVICHILSFLPTKLSVATSILARRWRFLWAYVPILNFDFVNDDYPRHLRTSFPSIINRVMSLHRLKSLNTFRLTCMNDFIDDEFGTCIATAIERNVQNLDLSLIVELPQCFLTCKTLVDLRIYDGVTLPSSGDISLPSLKKLSFNYFEYEVDLPHLLSGCPVLEELTILGPPYHNSGCCNISLPTLKKLTIYFPLDSSEFDNPDYRVKINAPALRYLDVYDCSYEHISISPLTSLIEADIWLYSLPSDLRFVFKFLDSLCNVKSLGLFCSYEFPDLGVAGSYVRFDNLTKLELAADWRFLTKFLESADHLEVLIIREVYEDLKNWMEPMEERCACLLHSLRTVRIDGFRCTEQSFNMVRYILRNAQVLKRMEIYCHHHGVGWKEKFDALQRISLFHRGSRECELAFY